MIKSVEPVYDVIIAGSGLGGLLCGNILAREGMRVCILEKHHQPGGCLQTFKRKGISFDTGVHYFGSMDPGQTLYRYWNYFGLSGSLKLERMNPDGFDIIGIGDDEYPVAMGFQNFTEQLLPCFPSGKEIFEKYTRSLREISSTFPLYNLEAPGDHQEDHYRGIGAYEFISELAGKFEISGSPERKRKTRQRLVHVLTGNNLLYAGNPGHTPLHILALINHSFISSAWRPVNGSDQIANKLVENLLSMGGEIVLNQEISRIDVKSRFFTIKTLSGDIYSSVRFISGIHPAKTLGMMDSVYFRKSFTQRITELKNTDSSFALYLVLNDRAFTYLDHNYYYHKREEERTKGPLADWPGSFMLTTPAPATEDGYAKSMIILASMPFTRFMKWENTVSVNRGNEYLEFKTRCADSLLDLAERKFPGIRPAINYMEISTPLTWRDLTGTPEGSMYGIERDFHEPLMTTLFPDTKIPGFYFTGQNINIHGVLGVTIGAVLTCSKILGAEYLLSKIKKE